MKIRNMEFELSAVKPGQWPQDGLPEFAFVGRSNVGKSSLLNRLLGRKSFARVSATPGKTQQINFFCINQSFRFADLPGYGFAKVSKRDREQFAKMVETYLLKREPLYRVLHLIDIRHEPSQQDIEVHQWMLEQGLPIYVVATKLDKVSKNATARSVQVIRKALDTPVKILPVSSEQNVGIDALWDQLESDLAAAAKDAEPAPSDVGVGQPHTGEHKGSAGPLED